MELLILGVVGLLVVAASAALAERSHVPAPLILVLLQGGTLAAVVRFLRPSGVDPERQTAQRPSSRTCSIRSTRGP